jgi:aldehyde:ferredoxin oxidoreductase
MNLYAGNILRVDLSAGRAWAEPLRPDWLRTYWGGWGLANRYFMEYAKPGVDALAPETPVVIMTGVFCGTSVPMTSRFCLVSKSPLTGTIFESNAGGSFAPELKFAGYDGVVITGKADRPVYLQILDDDVTLQDASGLWGKGIFETEELLRQAAGSPQAKAMAIGPAGENLVPFSCISTECYRQFGRGGCGALLGAKNLKGIVARGTGSVEVADMAAFLEKIEACKQDNLFTSDNEWASSDGTAILVDATNEMGVHPTRNFRDGVNPGKDGLNSDAVKAAKTGDRACHTCPMACGKFVSFPDCKVEGPEYETLCLGGSNCEINDMRAVVRFNELCDDLGLDTISAGNVIGLAMDLADQGIKDFGLRFGEEQEYFKAVDEMARLSTERGRDLALGARALGARYDTEDLAAHTKGMEFPAYEPRGSYGMGLSYATSERGACHLRAFTIFTETPFDLQAMTDDVIAFQDLNGIKWCLCICDFWGTADHKLFADLLSVGLGEPVTVEEMVLAGERVWNMTRIYNVREGFTSAEDTIPQRFMKQGLGNGPHKGRVLPPEDMAAMLGMYYHQRGWDAEGRPTDEKLRQLGLEEL